MEKRKCPEHIGTGVTPKDEECHSHESDLQQRFHNLHCKIAGCPHAKPGKERHDDIPTIKPRNKLEHLLKKLDGKKEE